MTFTNFAVIVGHCFEHAVGDGAAGVLAVALEQAAHEVDVLGVVQRLEVDHLLVAADVEVAVRVVDVGDAAAHAGREVAPGLADDDDAAAGHVLAAVVADAFDDGHRAASCGRRSARRRRRGRRACRWSRRRAPRCR